MSDLVEVKYKPSLIKGITRMVSGFGYTLKEKVRWKIFRFLFQRPDSNLVNHAIREMKLVGLDQKDADYGGMLYNAVLDVMRVFSAQGHSGFSAGRTRWFFHKLSNFDNLSALTNDPNEWMDISEINGSIMYQSKRNSACFSTSLKTYYNINEWKGRKTKKKYYKLKKAA